MCGDVATPNLYVVAQQNCLQAPDTKTTVMGRRSGSSSSNDDVERAAPKAGVSACAPLRRDGADRSCAGLSSEVEEGAPRVLLWWTSHRRARMRLMRHEGQPIRT